LAIVYLLDRGSVVTLVRQVVDLRTKQPVGMPATLATVTAVRPGLLPAPMVNLISVSVDRVFFNLAEAHGNVGLTRLE
jgi:hypothetical protein